jgi:hypothetical protein
MAELSDEQRKEIGDLLFAGHKIEAIKRCREYCSLGLSEAKGFIDEYEAALRAASPNRFAAQPNGVRILADAGLERMAGTARGSQGVKFTEQHISPDGLITLAVAQENIDKIIGFVDFQGKCFQWHTHGDLLVEFSGLPEDLAIRKFIDDVLGNRVIIAVSSVGGVVRDIAVTYDPESDVKYKSDDEDIVFRYWDGSTAVVLPKRNGANGDKANQ